jgi:hypothetical protein
MWSTQLICSLTRLALNNLLNDLVAHSVFLKKANFVSLTIYKIPFV